MSKLPKAIELAMQNVEQIEAQVNSDTQMVQPEVVPESTSQQVEHTSQNDNWEHKFNILKGKYNAEVPRLAAEKRQLNEQLRQMEQRLMELESQNKKSLVTPQEIEEFGEPLVDLIRRAAKEEVSSKDKDLEVLKYKLQQVERDAIDKSQSDFYAELSGRVPDWQKLNKDQGFLDWLAEPDELSGRERQDLLEKAEGDRDAIRVARFFEAYKQQSTRKHQTAKDSLERQVVPDKGAPSVAPNQGRMITQQDLATAAREVMRGKMEESDLRKIHEQFLQQQKRVASR